MAGRLHPDELQPGLDVERVRSAFCPLDKDQNETSNRAFFSVWNPLGFGLLRYYVNAPCSLDGRGFHFFGEGWKKGGKGIIFFIMGLTIGLMPYYFAGWLISGANQAVSGSYPWPEALKRAWPLIQTNLPVATGITPCLYPDFKTTLTLIPGIALPFTFIYLLVLGTVTAARGFHHLKELPERKWLTLNSLMSFWESPGSVCSSSP